MSTLYAQYDAADNAAPGGHSPDTIWNAAADGSGAWGTPATGDTLDTNGHDVTASQAVGSGYPGVLATAYIIRDTAGSPGSYTFNSFNYGALFASTGSIIELASGHAGLVVVLAGGQVTFSAMFAGSEGPVIVVSGGSVEFSNSAPNYDTITIETGGSVEFNGASADNWGYVLCESGGSVSFLDTADNLGIVAYYTDATVSGISGGGNPAVAIGSERRTTHFTGSLASSISILDDTKVLKNTDIIVAASNVKKDEGRWTGATGGDVGTYEGGGGYTYGDDDPSKVLQNAAAAGTAYGDADPTKVLTTAAVAGTYPGDVVSTAAGAFRRARKRRRR